MGMAFGRRHRCARLPSFWQTPGSRQHREMTFPGDNTNDGHTQTMIIIRCIFNGHLSSPLARPSRGDGVEEHAFLSVTTWVHHRSRAAQMALTA
jgi:hypothetical protein